MVVNPGKAVIDSGMLSSLMATEDNQVDSIA